MLIVICLSQKCDEHIYLEKKENEMQILVNAYKFEDLSDRAKEKVANWINEYDWDRDLYDCEVDYWKEEILSPLGYSDIEIQWSGFYGNDDGASIICTVNVADFIKRNKYGNKYRSLNYWAKQCNMTVDIRRQSYYRGVDHRGLYSSVDDAKSNLYSYDDNITPVSDLAYSQLDSCASDILEEVADKSQELYYSLRREYDSHWEEEYIRDMCDANEYLFDEDGKPVHHLGNLVVAEKEEETA